MTSPSHIPDLLYQDAVTAAPSLLGWVLVCESPQGITAGTIVEVEAYHGPDDPASHAFRGPTTRTAPMFREAGCVYVYLSYGIHTCLNLVTGPAGSGQAVLIRALKPTLGLDLMRERRGQSNPLHLTNGPGKLAQALGIGREFSGAALGGQIRLLPPETPVPAARIDFGPRIGITAATDKPWRFWIKDNAYVSRRTPRKVGRI
jgi:DNA-3-methyladenine glycosylase